MNQDERQKEIMQIVKARLETMPQEAILSIGSYGEFNRDQLIKEVEQNTEIGRKIIDIQMQYLQMLKEGIFYEKTGDNQT